MQVGKRVYEQHDLNKSRTRVPVLDDMIKARRGKKVESMSSQYDHVSNAYVMGQQVLTLGLATDEAFLPMDSQIYVSDSKAHSLINPYMDGRNVGEKRYQEAISQTKVEMAVGMIRRAVRAGIKAYYVAANSWFGNKELMRAGLSLEMTAILRMKRNKLQCKRPITPMVTMPLASLIMTNPFHIVRIFYHAIITQVHRRRMGCLD